MRALASGGRDLFRLVSRAAFANPFGDERDRTDRALAGRGVREQDILDRVVRRVRARLEAISPDGEPVRFDGFRADDAVLVQHAIVFDVFHRFFGGMDAHIAAQRQAGKTPVRAAFGPPMLASPIAKISSPTSSERDAHRRGVLALGGRGLGTRREGHAREDREGRQGQRPEQPRERYAAVCLASSCTQRS
jgi:hypothetical protein